MLKAQRHYMGTGYVPFVVLVLVNGGVGDTGGATGDDGVDAAAVEL